MILKCIQHMDATCSVFIHDARQFTYVLIKLTPTLSTFYKYRQIHAEIWVKCLANIIPNSVSFLDAQAEKVSRNWQRQSWK